ncbi:MAG: PorT family protein [Bacteroidaceae bacterium]|nr:PorT family protein [Alistipes sp.]MBR5842852.1 PorT family protein [Bacteroidaceae bacterium]
MKKYLTLLVLIACSFTGAKAQFNWGLKAGVNVANVEELTQDNLLQTDSYTGFYIGPKFDLTIIGRVGINGSILYSQSGMVWANEQEAIDMNTLSVPLNLMVRLFGSEKFGLFLETGPQFDFNIGEKRHELQDGQLSLDDSALSFNLGASLHLLKFLQVGVNYNVPFGATNEFQFSDMENKEAYKFNTIQASVAIVF